MPFRIFYSLQNSSVQTIVKSSQIYFDKLCYHSAHLHVKPDDRFSNALDHETRVATVKRIEKSNYRKPNSLENLYAVLVSLCCVNGVPSLLYTVRSSDLKSHSGQVSFPGGACDPTDRDVMHAALRETEEEIGVPQGAIDVWAVMPKLRRGPKLIYPVIGNLGNLIVDELRHNESEVSEIFTVPLEFLCDRKNYRYTVFIQAVSAGRKRVLYPRPVFLTQPRVWGLTAVATELFLSYMFPDIFCNPYSRHLIT